VNGIGNTRQIKALDKRREQGPSTYVNTVDFLLFSIFTTLITQRSGLTAEDEAVWKETEEDGFRQVHYSLAVNAETLSSEVQREASEQRRLYVRLHGSLGYLSDDAGHVELNNEERAANTGEQAVTSLTDYKINYINK
jgi:hypothetical protein